jgi:hypothetical protein
MKGRQAVRNVTTSATKMVSLKQIVTVGLLHLKEMVPAITSSSPKVQENETESTGAGAGSVGVGGNDINIDNNNGGGGGGGGSSNVVKSNRDIKSLKNEAIEAFHSVIKAWNEAMVLDYKCYSGLMAVMKTVELFEKLPVNQLVGVSTSDKIKVCVYKYTTETHSCVCFV